MRRRLKKNIIAYAKAFVNLYGILSKERLAELPDEKMIVLKELIADLVYNTRMMQHNGFISLEIGGLGLEEYEKL